MSMVDGLPAHYFGDDGKSDNGESTSAWIEATRDLAAAEIVMRLVAQRNSPWRFVGNSSGMTAALRRGVLRRRNCVHTQLAIVARHESTWSYELGWASWYSLAGVWSRPRETWHVLSTYDPEAIRDAAQLWRDVNAALSTLSGS